MISTRLSDLILLCMIPGLATIGLWWIISIWVERARDRVMRSNVIRCRICGCAYRAAVADGKVSHCPSCGSANLLEPDELI